MIKCNLAVLLAERGLKMADLINNTSLSKTAVRGLYYNESKGIQFETLETICDYLNVEPEDVIKKIKFKYEIIDKNIDEDNLIIIYTMQFNYDSKEIKGNVEVFLSGPDPEDLFENELSSFEISIDIEYKKPLKHDVLSQITSLESEKLESFLINDFIETFNLENHTVISSMVTFED